MANNLLFRKDERMGKESHYVRWLSLHFLYYLKIAFIISENSDGPSSVCLDFSLAAG